MSMGTGFNISDFCTAAGGILQFIGYILLVFKIFIPLVIILLGALDFGKAVVASKDDEIKKQGKRLLWRILAGVCIFFIPNVVVWVFSTISDYNESLEDFTNCQTCVLHPSNCVVIDR